MENRRDAIVHRGSSMAMQRGRSAPSAGAADRALAAVFRLR